MPENLFPIAVLDLIRCLERHEAYWAEYFKEAGPVLGISPELYDLLCAIRPDKTGFWQMLSHPGWEELIESQDPVLLQQAAYAAQLKNRPFLADSLEALADVAEEMCQPASHPVC